MPRALQSVHTRSGPPHASSAYPSTQPPSLVQHPPHSLTGHGAQQTTPTTWPAPPLGLQMSNSGSHAWHVVPPMPHAACAVPGWQVPASSQHPGQVVGPQPAASGSSPASGGGTCKPVRLPQPATEQARATLEDAASRARVEVFTRRRHPCTRALGVQGSRGVTPPSPCRNARGTVICVSRRRERIMRDAGGTLCACRTADQGLRTPCGEREAPLVP